MSNRGYTLQLMAVIVRKKLSPLSLFCAELTTFLDSGVAGPERFPQILPRMDKYKIHIFSI